MRSKYTARIVFILAVLASQPTFAAPPLINYQGFLTDAGGQPLNEVTSVTFRIWTKLDPATSTVSSDLVWAEKHAAVSVVDGRINVILGNGTPVQTDLTAATNAVENLGEAFREDATYIGITINDANNQYDSGEEITPRQQLLSVPYALNGGGSSVLSGLDDTALSDPGDVGKVVEIAARQDTLRLAKDIASRYRLVRGVYLGKGRIQLLGTASIHRTDLQPGEPVYLSNTQEGVVVRSNELEGRSLATLVGYALDQSRVGLHFTFTQLNDDLVSPEDIAPLQDPGFEIVNSPVWLGIDGTPGAANTSTAGVPTLLCGTQYADPAGRNLYQIVDIPAVLTDLADSGGLRVTFGGSTCCNVTAGEYRLDFYLGHPGSDLDAGFEFHTLPFSVTNDGCNKRSKTVCVPCGARNIRLLLDSTGNFVRWDDIQLEFSVSTPEQCLACP